MDISSLNDGTTRKRDNAQNVHCPFFDVVPPPGLPKKRATAKLIGNSLRRTSAKMCVLRQDCQRGECEGRS